jgi:hypothetical protein
MKRENENQTINYKKKRKWRTDNKLEKEKRK